MRTEDWESKVSDRGRVLTPRVKNNSHFKSRSSWNSPNASSETKPRVSLCWRPSAVCSCSLLMCYLWPPSVPFFEYSVLHALFIASAHRSAIHIWVRTNENRIEWGIYLVDGENKRSIRWIISGYTCTLVIDYLNFLLSRKFFNIIALQACRRRPFLHICNIWERSAGEWKSFMRLTIRQTARLIIAPESHFDTSSEVLFRERASGLQLALPRAPGGGSQ